MDIPMIDMKATGANIKRLRKEKGITVKEIQNIMGFNAPVSIYRWQVGASLPTTDNLVILAHVLGVKVDDILIIKE